MKQSNFLKNQQTKMVSFKLYIPSVNFDSMIHCFVCVCVYITSALITQKQEYHLNYMGLPIPHPPKDNMKYWK